jgi:hypothetical protein
MSASPRILMAGAGWRISTFVVPALLALGFARTDMTIFRRRQVEPEGILAGIRGVNQMTALAGPFDLVINCVAPRALVEVQSGLLELFPRAVHFCDTPVLGRLIDVPGVLRPSEPRNLFSLEDWPSMPNLRPIIALCKDSPRDYRLVFEHIGIDTHFLSVARSVSAAAGLGCWRVITRQKRELIDRPVEARSRCILRGPKDFARSKVTAWNGSHLIEDFFEIRDGSDLQSRPSSPETIFRVIADDRVRYFLGGDCFHEVAVPRAITDILLGKRTRDAVHRLDKCAALIGIFQSALEGKTEAYGYWQSSKDALAARFAGKIPVALPW